MAALELKTALLRLRREEDRDAFAVMSADPEVMRASGGGSKIRRSGAGFCFAVVEFSSANDRWRQPEP
jgi:hypothetical protein